MKLVHNSRQKLEKLGVFAKQIDGFEDKPRGLWYSPENIWNYSCNYKYEIELEYTTWEKPDSTKVLKITTCKEFDEFTFKYGGGEVYEMSNRAMDWTDQINARDEVFTKHRHVLINWYDVSKDFAGFELIPLLKNRDKSFIELSPSVQDKYIKRFGKYTDLIWIRNLDVPSGCVWNCNRKTTLKKFELIHD
jgi:hypothetical protein